MHGQQAVCSAGVTGAHSRGDTQRCPGNHAAGVSWHLTRGRCAGCLLTRLPACPPPLGSQGAERGDLVETFSKVLGVFVHYTDEKVDATVKSWNVKILGLNRQSRHRDATVSQASRCAPCRS